MNFEVFSVVMILCSLCNVLGMLFNLPSPPIKLWLGSWFALAIIAGVICG